MGKLRSVLVFIIFAVALSVIVHVGAQSGSVSPSRQTLQSLDLPDRVAVRPQSSIHAVKFAKATGYHLDGSGYSVAIGDVNGDGYADLIVSGCDGNCVSDPGIVGVLLGKGDGTFQAITEYSSGGYDANSVAVSDVNGDGYLDIVVANGCTDVSCANGAVSILLGNGDGTFQTPMSYSTAPWWAASLVVADVNRDGHPDIVVANGCDGCTQGEVSVLLGNGDGTFQMAESYESGGYEATSLAVADVNGDGSPDIIVATYCTTGCVAVLLGNGDGTFQTAVSYAAGARAASSVAIGDLNGDGYPDLVLGDMDVTVMIGNGDGTFEPPVNYSSDGSGAISVAIGDVNGDGRPDLVAANPCYSHACNDGAAGVLLGNGDGTFQQPVSYLSGGRLAGSVAVSDVNGDGRLDLIVVNEAKCWCAKELPTGTAGVLLNEFTVKTGTKVKSSPNPSQVGQLVTFTATIAASSPVPNGTTVTFYNGASEIGTAVTMNEVASLATSFSSAGKYVITADYPGDAFHTASSGSAKQVVTQ
jgi:hypothetical protein